MRKLCSTCILTMFLVVATRAQGPTGEIGGLVTDSTGAVVAVIEHKRILEPSLNGRNYLHLAALIPGSTTNGPASSQGQQRMGGARNSFSLNVSGQPLHARLNFHF